MLCTRTCTSGGEAGWALAQAAAGVLVEQRLRALGGGPADTLAAVEAALQVRRSLTCAVVRS